MTRNKSNEPRMYQPMWELLKQHGTVQVDLTLSTSTVVQQKLLRTLRKAIQKEKYRDTNFRLAYPNASLSSEVILSGRTVILRIDKGLAVGNDSALKLFGE